LNWGGYEFDTDFVVVNYENDLVSWSFIMR